MPIILCLLLGAVIGLVIRAAINAGKNNAPKEYSYSCSKAQLENAINNAVVELKYKIEKFDSVGGRIKIGVGTSLSSFGEWIEIQLSELSDDRTKMLIQSRAKYGRENFKKNDKNIEKLLDVISNKLK